MQAVARERNIAVDASPYDMVLSTLNRKPFQSDKEKDQMKNDSIEHLGSYK